MRLTTKGRYAVTAMLDLALHGTDRPVSLADISGRQDISLSYGHVVSVAGGPTFAVSKSFPARSRHVPPGLTVQFDPGWSAKAKVF